MMNRNSENGNVIVFIFIAIALLGALTFTFTSSNRTSTGVLTGAQADAYASQITAYGHDVKQAVKRVMLRGCDETEVSFENSLESGYTNPNAPNNESCHVFSKNGGGLAFQNLSYGQNGTVPPFFTAGTLVLGVGGSVWSNLDHFDLVLFIPLKSLETCKKINEKFKNPEALAIDYITQNSNYDSDKFQGVYFQRNGIPDDSGNIAGYTGVKTGCMQSLDTPAGLYPYSDGYDYFYYNVLIER